MRLTMKPNIVSSLPLQNGLPDIVLQRRVADLIQPAVLGTWLSEEQDPQNLPWARSSE